MSTFQILYFASASSYTGKSSESLPAPLPLSQLFPLLEGKYPGIMQKVLQSCSVSVGLEYVDVPVPASASAAASASASASGGHHVGESGTVSFSHQKEK
jgi:hypothetical protein